MAVHGVGDGYTGGAWRELQEIYIFTSITGVYSSIVARTARTMGSDHDRAARLKEVLWSDKADKALKAKVHCSDRLDQAMDHAWASSGATGSSCPIYTSGA